VAIQNVRLAQPRELASLGSQLGVDLEADSLRQGFSKRASEYIALRRRSEGARLAFGGVCRRGKDPFCEFEAERLEQRTERAARRASRSAIALQRLTQTQAIRKALSGDLADASALSYSDAVSAIGRSLRDAEMRELADKVVAQPCAGSALPAALGLQLEDQWPDEKAIGLSERLFDKSVQCAGQNSTLASAQAAYRLALLDISRQRCDRSEALLTHTQSSQAAWYLHSRSLYWMHHCLQRNSEEAKAEAVRLALVQRFPLSFHALAVAKDQELVGTFFTAKEPTVALRSIVVPELNDRLRAVESLIKLGANGLAAEFIDWSLQHLDLAEPELRLYAAELMNRAEQSLTKFKVLGSLFQDAPRMFSERTLKLFFPVRFWDQIRAHQETVDPLLVLALIRQESAFNHHARSIAGARGLMQVMPATARWIASVRANRLFDPSVNIRVGTRYLSKRLSQLDQDVDLTLAAYNAGAHRVSSWKKRYLTDNPLLFVDLIPFRETREYVAIILRNYFWYSQLYGDELGLQTGTLASATRPKRGPAEIRSESMVARPRVRPVIDRVAMAMRANSSVEPNQPATQGLSESQETISSEAAEPSAP
jgi:soluble lytic murein transglycosylase